MLLDRISSESMPMAAFIDSVATDPPHKVAGTGVFLTLNPERVPNALLHNLKHNQVLHERVILLTIVVEDIPYVPKEDYIWIDDLGHGFWRIVGHYGFKETPDVPVLLADCKLQNLEFEIMETTFFLNRESIVSTSGKGFAIWRGHLFIWMSHLAAKASDYYRIPSNRVVELGTQIEL